MYCISLLSSDNVYHSITPYTRPNLPAAFVPVENRGDEKNR